MRCICNRKMILNVQQTTNSFRSLIGKHFFSIQLECCSFKINLKENFPFNPNKKQHTNIAYKELKSLRKLFANVEKFPIGNKTQTDNWFSKFEIESILFWILHITFGLFLVHLIRTVENQQKPALRNEKKQKENCKCLETVKTKCAVRIVDEKSNLFFCFFSFFKESWFNDGNWMKMIEICTKTKRDNYSVNIDRKHRRKEWTVIAHTNIVLRDVCAVAFLFVFSTSEVKKRTHILRMMGWLNVR